jgi:hypothetical protein
MTAPPLLPFSAIESDIEAKSGLWLRAAVAGVAGGLQESLDLGTEVDRTAAAAGQAGGGAAATTTSPSQTTYARPCNGPGSDASAPSLSDH